MSSSDNMAGSGPQTAVGLSVRCVSALDAARDGDDNDNDDDDNDDVDDNALVLTCDQLQQVNEFRELLDSTDNTDQLQLCTEKYSELLRHDTSLQILIAAYDDIISATYRGYKNKKKEKTSTRTPLPTGRNQKTVDNTERDE